ncbi:hypothetical protein PEC302107_16250 [Pectobacterium araliae]|nr:hypothetical protein PEC302107_16250 [Pectobacterium carotovorum subsp. carotovorum]
MDNVTPTPQQFTSPLNRILLKISKYQPNLHLTTNEFSYLAAMAMWGMEEAGVESDSEHHFVQSGYDETTCHNIIRYVDERINEDLNTSDVRVNNFLKRALEQGLLSLAGISVADFGGTYRLTQLAYDLLKPFQQSDESEDKETLSQRYLRIDQELSSLNAISDGNKIPDSEWLMKVALFLPSLQDLLTGVFKNQEFLISKFHSMRSEMQTGIDVSLETEIQQLLETIRTLAGQINDLRKLVMNRADAVLMQLEILQNTVVQKGGTQRLKNALSSLFSSLTDIREFANYSLRDLSGFFNTVLDRIRIRIALDPNANLGYLIDRTIELFGQSSWSLALPSAVKLMQLREWDTPPPPADNALFLDDNDDEELVREMPAFQLESFAREFVEKALSDNKPVSNVSIIRSILSKFSFNETDRFRLVQCTIKEIMKQSNNIQDDVFPEWVLMDGAASYEIEEQWIISQGGLDD